MSKFKSYIIAFRLRTLPLALSSILMGNFIAAYNKTYTWQVGIWAILTTLFLQILSNVANDYGDAVSGADNEGRIGPERMVSSGNISVQEMKMTVIVFSMLSFISGIILITVGNFETMSFKAWGLFILGLGAIAAAIKYTVGKNPYGYKGMGDIFVFLFFGLTGVLGTYFLHAGTFEFWIMLPASAIGLLSAGVLNLNNLRDAENDARTGKNTLIVQLGSSWGKKYHMFLIIGAIILMLVYTLFQLKNYWQWLFLPACALLLKDLMGVLKINEPQKLDPYLKKLALSTFALVVLFGVGLLF